MAQSDSLFAAFQLDFRKNLSEVNRLQCFSDTGFYPGKFRWNQASDFNHAFLNLNLPVFKEPVEHSAAIYTFLENLPVLEKKNLVQLFSYYESAIEKELRSAGLPLELKYLAPAFSAMNPVAAGFGNRAGVWQLAHFQAVLNGLSVNSLVDERMNVLLATPAFTKMMKQNISNFENTELAILAGIYGSTNVKNAIYKSGEQNDIGHILNYLPGSASVYIAAFQASSVFFNQNHFRPDIETFVNKENPDTVKVFRKLHFQQVKSVLNVSVEELHFLNPQYKFAIVPGVAVPHKLAVPNGKRDDFVLFQDSVYHAGDSSLFEITVQRIEYPPAPNRQYLGEPVKDLVIEGKTKIRYTLKTGDVLGIIAEDFDVDVADLKYWNNIVNERKIQAGKKLDIFVDNEKAEYYQSLAGSAAKKESVTQKTTTNFQQPLKVLQEVNAGPKVEHVVKSGESPFTIAKKYDGVTPEDLLRWNNIKDERKIQIGQKLIVYLKK